MTLVVKNLTATAEDIRGVGLIPGSGRSPGGRAELPRKIPWRRAELPTPVYLPEESHGQRSLMGYNPWGHKESDMTEVT